FTYSPTCPFNHLLKRESYICVGLNISCKNSHFTFKKTNVFNYARFATENISKAYKIGARNTLTKFYAPSYKKKHKIWLYCDSSKTVKDNAYYQFIHDINKNDGIERYYVYNPEADIDGWFDDSMKQNLIEYGSLKHRLYGLSADKILTSFYGLRDILSYPYGAFKYFADLTNFDVIYLQHGVLHANLPTMYSLDRMMLDREVISTEFEAKSLVENYCFDEAALIKCGMPRYNHIDTTKKAEKKILFAPSWRKFLVNSDGKGSWLPKEKAFLDSDFYKVTSAFLEDKRLIEALKKYGYVLDFKMHPNFRMYDEYYKVDGETVRIADKTVDEFSYGIFITDFSSFVFDFVYLKRPILYFVPDMDLFEAGLNHYRKLDLPFEEGFGDFSADKDKAVDNIIYLLENNCVPEKKYVDRMEGLFFPIEDHSEALYQELIK
ncbi:MAG: CDP-glycerol glycerophosphotransferase family protein, partial [Ruminococcus sp.]|nr:CDP-glycerol glycerophosphotransferase family protein [Candidatus Copronaster equi]